VLSMRRLCAEVQLILRHLLCLCEFNHSEFHGHSNLRDRGERHELPLLYLSERKRIHLHVVMSLFAHGPDLLPNSKPAGRKRWKPGLHQFLLADHLLPEWFHKPVQCHLRFTIWNLDHLSGFLWRIPLLGLFLSKLHTEVQLVLRHVLCLCEFYHSEFHGHHSLRDVRQRDKLPMVFLPQRQCLHVPVYLHHFLLRNPMLRGLPSS